MEAIINFIYQFIDFIKPDNLINWLLDLLGVYVYFGLFFIVFAETGLAVGFFLPGDSLLVVTGLMAKTLPDKLNVYLVITAFLSGSILGDSTGYWTGRFMGKSLFKREDSFLFKPSRVNKASKFFEKYGAKTIVLARFVPIVRTFRPDRHRRFEDALSEVLNLLNPRRNSLDFQYGFGWVLPWRSR